MRFSYSRPDDPLLKKAVVCGTKRPCPDRVSSKGAISIGGCGPAREKHLCCGHPPARHHAGLLMQRRCWRRSRQRALCWWWPTIPLASPTARSGDLITPGATRCCVTMTHSLLCQPPEAARFRCRWILAARRRPASVSVRTRMDAVQWLKDGHRAAVPGGWRGHAPCRRQVRRWTCPGILREQLAGVQAWKVQPLFFHGWHPPCSTSPATRTTCCGSLPFFRETLRQLGASMPVRIPQPCQARVYDAIERLEELFWRA